MNQEPTPNNTPDPAETQPAATQPIDAESLPKGEPPARKRRHWSVYILIYIVVLLGISSIAYLRGRSIKDSREGEVVSQFLQEQFDLGVLDMQAGRYETARMRFEAIIRFDPTFPNAEENLIEVYVVMRKPSPVPTAKPTSTPDPSPPDTLFSQAQQAITEGDWDTAINKLLTLRSKDPTYKAVEADGMMFIALRNRGMDQIAQGSMEEGLYDLSLAERFGPLDRDAMFRKTLAEQYLLANSYIGLNWFEAASLFLSLCEQGATLDSCYKYAEAAWKYGDILWIAEDPCGSQLYYGGSITAVPDSTLEPTATAAAKVCLTVTAPPPVPPTATATPEGTPEEPPPNETPTPTE